MSESSSSLLKSIADLEKQYKGKLPPVEKWDPPFSGDIDIVIAPDGRWFHEGDEMKRQSLVKLFSSILKKEGDEYFLVTPVEKWRLTVEDAPFLIMEMEFVDTESGVAISFTTQTDDRVLLTKTDQWIIKNDVPYVVIRNNLLGKLNRSVYYEIVNKALDQSESSDMPCFYSAGTRFCLG